MNGNYWENSNSSADFKFKRETSKHIPLRSLHFTEAPLNFSTAEEMDYSVNSHKSGRTSRQDPLSHRIIEKRRRDRMNNCLADLSRLIPSDYLKKGRGRVEKTEIIEMAIKHMKHLQYLNHYRLGYQECMSECMRFLTENNSKDTLNASLSDHLTQHCNLVFNNASADLQMDQMDETKHPIAEQCFEKQDGNDSMVQENNAYKYKNDIKLRFCRDNNQKQNVDFQRYQMELSHQLKQECDEKQELANIASNSSQSPQEMGSFKGKNIYVPCFVLHAEGSFYVPVNVELNSLKPFLQQKDDLVHVSNDLVLHPVAINVNFTSGCANR